MGTFTYTAKSLTAYLLVSIQLISPASGDLRCAARLAGVCQLSFHSTDFPSEWGLSIGMITKSETMRFHSTDFPSEWGLVGCTELQLERYVSIQLISPASGDLITPDPFRESTRIVSIQLISPASGDSRYVLNVPLYFLCFHSTDFPSEWGPKSS